MSDRIRVYIDNEKKARISNITGILLAQFCRCYGCQVLHSLQFWHFDKKFLKETKSKFWQYKVFKQQCILYTDVGLEKEHNWHSHVT